MPLFELKAEIAAAAAEAGEEILLEVGVPNWSVLEDAIARRAWIIGVFPSEGEARLRWSELRLLLPQLPLSEPLLRPLPESDWRDSYKAHFKAWRFGRLQWVPIWERAAHPRTEGDAVLWLDPGLAFGTGNHETTRLCIERLVALDERLATPEMRKTLRIVDAGCGSGILALSAALLGFEDVRGFDVDPEAVRVSLENALLNDLDGRVSFALGDLSLGLAGTAADVVLANIQSDVLIRHADDLIGAVAPAGTLILSGILAEELDSVRAAYAAAAPLWNFDSRILGEWADLVLTNTAGKPPEN
jgi:ribosomal protein L11 methyltransferase